MVKLEEHKHLTEDRPIEKMPEPKKAYIPLSQHLGKPCLALVKAQDTVSLGQKIAAVEAHVYAPIHSSISGKVIAIEDWPHPSLGRCKSIIIENGGSGKPQSAGPRTQDEIDKLSPEQVRAIIFEAGIVGMGGAGFPSHIKLNPAKLVDTLIINAAECEPYLTADYRLMIEKMRELVSAIGLIKRILAVKDVYLAIEDNKPKAIEGFRIQSCGFKVKVLKTAYPQGGEKQLIKSVLGREVPSGKLPFDVGVIVHNIGTVFAIYEAVYNSKPLYERVVTVTGSCLTNPKNLLARVGTPIRELIEYCGPLKEEPAKIIMGGPMMGIAQYTDEVPVIKTTSGVTLLNKKEARVLDEEFCIRCGACVRECPSGLMPCLINLASEKKLWQQAKGYGAMDCIECGVCSYICPARRRLVQSIKRAKLEATR